MPNNYTIAIIRILLCVFCCAACAPAPYDVAPYDVDLNFDPATCDPILTSDLEGLYDIQRALYRQLLIADGFATADEWPDIEAAVFDNTLLCGVIQTAACGDTAIASGCSKYDDNGVNSIWVSAERVATINYILSHEIGHLLLHWRGLPGDLHHDSSFFQVDGAVNKIAEKSVK